VKKNNGVLHKKIAKYTENSQQTLEFMASLNSTNLLV